MNLDVVILGASGYGGGELLRWLACHPHVKSIRGTSRSRAGQAFWKGHPNLRGLLDGSFEQEIDWQSFAASEQPVVIAALPHGELAKALPDLEAAWTQAGIANRLLLIDLSGDFRMRTEEEFLTYYKKPHPCPERLSSFVYGLPELNRALLPGARRIANPGCFATALQLAVLPLRGLQMGFLAASAATGSTGSGITPSEGTHHPARAHDFRAYKVFSHQHLGEVRMTMEACGITGNFAFVPQSAPMTRGIFVTLQFPLPEGMDGDTLRERVRTTFSEAPFIRITEESPRVTAVTGSNFSDVYATAKDGCGAILVAIDNLGKGMASQAIQNMNLALGLPETAGLKIPARYPS